MRHAYASPEENMVARRFLEVTRKGKSHWLTRVIPCTVTEPEVGTTYRHSFHRTSRKRKRSLTTLSNKELSQQQHTYDVSPNASEQCGRNERFFNIRRSHMNISRKIDVIQRLPSHSSKEYLGEKPQSKGQRKCSFG